MVRNPAVVDSRSTWFPSTSTDVCTSYRCGSSIDHNCGETSGSAMFATACSSGLTTTIPRPGDHVGLAAEMRERRQVDVGAVVATPVVADDIAVEPDRGECRHSVELELDVTAAVAVGQSEALSVPADALRVIALVAVGVFVERLLDDEVVRQVEDSPAAVVIFDARRPGPRAGLGVAVSL